MTTRVVVEADGGSRGNPGPAAYGAVVLDAETGAVLAEDARRIGVATNNVAEYRGLVAGLRLVHEVAAGAAVEVRMDSKLVVEQMAGNWKVKHPDLKPLHAEAARLAPAGTSYAWVPRAQNAHADRLLNEALDGVREGVRLPDDPPDSLAEEASDPDTTLREEAGIRGWSPTSDVRTTLILVRHGVTVHTAEKRFSGGLASANPGLSDEGRAQVRATAEWLAPLADRVDVVLASPVRRTLESAEILASRLGHDVVVEPGFAEMEFGAWDGLTFAEVSERHREQLDTWLGSLEAAPHGGESFREVEQRVLAALDRVLAEHAGSTLVVVSHVTPIKTLVARVLRAPLDSIYRMELSPASVTVLTFFGSGPDPDDPATSMRLYNVRPPGHDGPLSGHEPW